MTSLVSAGKTRYWGVSNHTPGQVAEYIELAASSGAHGVAAIQDYYNIAGDESTAPDGETSRMAAPERDMFPLIRRSGMGVLAFSPMDTGFLAGNQPVESRSPIANLIRVLDQVAHELREGLGEGEALRNHQRHRQMHAN